VVEEEILDGFAEVAAAAGVEEDVHGATDVGARRRLRDGRSGRHSPRTFRPAVDCVGTRTDAC